MVDWWDALPDAPQQGGGTPVAVKAQPSALEPGSDYVNPPMPGAADFAKDDAAIAARGAPNPGAISFGRGAPAAPDTKGLSSPSDATATSGKGAGGNNWWDALPDAPASAQATAQAASGKTPTSKPTLGSVASNFGAGANAQIAGVAGAPVDAATWAMNKLAGAVQPPEWMSGKRPGSTPGPIQNPIGGSQSIQQGMEAAGARTPQSTQPRNWQERLASGIGGAVAAVPMMGLGGAAAAGAAGDTLAGKVGQSVVNQTPTGAALASATASSAVGGGAGQLAEEAVPENAPEWVKGGANILGNVVGGAGTATAGHYTGRAAGSGTRAVKDFVAPLGTEGQERLGAERYQQGLGDVGQARADLANNTGELVPGEKPTTLQVTGQGGETDRAMRQKFGGTFAARDAENNAARTDAITGLAPAGAESANVGTHLRQHFDDLDQAAAAEEVRAAQAVQGKTESWGGHEVPPVYGARAAEAVRQNYAPAMDAQERAAEKARQRAQAATGRLGGTDRPEVAGAAIRGERVTPENPTTIAIEAQRISAKAANDRLWQAFNPDNKLGMHMTGLKGSIAPILERYGETHETVPAGERAILNRIEALGEIDAVSKLKTLRTAINNAKSMSDRAGDYASSSRLRAYKEAVDQSLEAAVNRQHENEAAAVHRGEMKPEETQAARLQEWRDSFYNARDAAGENTEGRGGGAGRNGAERPAAVSGVGRAERNPAGRSGDAAVPAGVPGEELRAPTAEDVAAYKAARASHREYAGTYREGIVGKILKPGPSGDYATPDSGVGPAVWKPGPQGAETVREYTQKTKGDPAATQRLQDYVVSSLREKGIIGEDGTLDPGKFDRWMDQHKGALSEAPSIEQNLRAAARAHQSFEDALTQQRAIQASYPIKPGMPDSQVMSQYWRPKGRGGDGIQDFMRDTGGTRDALDALQGHVVSSMRNEGVITPDGMIDSRKFAQWSRRYKQALDAAPQMRDAFNDVAAAQETLNTVSAARAQAQHDFQKSVAGKIVGADTAQKTMAAIGEALKNPDQMRDIVARTRGNPDAEAGLKQMVIDHILDKVRSTVESGTSGVDRLKPDALQKYVKANRESLKIVLGGQGYQNLEAVAASIKRAGRSGNATQALPGSATGQNAAALESHTAGGHGGNSSIGALVAMEAVEKLQHAASRHPHVAAAAAGGHGAVAGGLMGGLPGAIIGAAAPIGVVVGNALRQAGLEKIDQVVARMALDPEFARAMMAKYPQNQLGQRRLAAKILALVPSIAEQTEQKESR